MLQSIINNRMFEFARTFVWCFYWSFVYFSIWKFFEK